MEMSRKRNKKSINWAQLFVKSILGGAFIAIGALAAGIGSQGDGLIYALIFPVGLIMLVLFNAALFTGAVTEVNDCLDKKTAWKLYAKKLGWLWLGNLVGAVAIGLLAFAVAKPATVELFQNMAGAKACTPLLILFAKGILCNILVCVAILLYRKIPNLLLLYIPIFVFVLSGFEHSIADMFVFTFAPSIDVILPLLVITGGNLVGGAAISAAWRYIQEKK
jgi:formate/nitrite transporter FocA (FNT family)